MKIPMGRKQVTEVELPNNPTTGEPFADEKTLNQWEIDEYVHFAGKRINNFSALLEKVPAKKMSGAYLDLKDIFVKSVRNHIVYEDEISEANQEIYGNSFAIAALACGYKAFCPSIYPWANWTVKDELKLTRYRFFKRVSKERREIALSKQKLKG